MTYVRLLVAHCAQDSGFLARCLQLDSENSVLEQSNTHTWDLALLMAWVDSHGLFFVSQVLTSRIIWSL
jgi:hypothetical protein